MRSKALWWALCVAAVLAFTAGIRTLAENETPALFGGVINDYSPISGGTTAWEVRGPWSMRLNEEAGTANFSAALTMELSVLGQSPATVLAVALNQHTHHIRMTHATVTYNPTDCPTFATANPIARIEVTGMAIVTANGGPFPPTSPTAVPSQLQVCIDGGTAAETIVPYSNITLVFGSPASGHFGPQAIHGVVRKASSLDDDERGRR
jgi:hypothetical protein